ncbi:kinase-like domain-containing protein [Aspergillus coremiiformis]|uniref:Kinase-like domain-containing protein n=1 Tax=Aspergillus coremiiformis TaxID=138285 RepID=A0A5N6Z7R6_9EURO|nr:kinase-like domain-containing protein [Aspergillus coremiiformis]
MQQQHFYEERIPFAISQLRSDKQVPTLTKHFDGGQCRVFKVDFVGGESWAVRVPLFVRNASQDTIIHLIGSEVRALEELEIKGFWWAAKLRGCSLTFDNAVGYPFIALTWIPGSQLSWSDDFPTRPIRDKVLSQVAAIHASLIEYTKETHHFMRIIQNKFRRVRSGLLPEITEQDCLDQMNILPGVLLPELNKAPFAMDHGDLSPQNILIDAQHNITGIIDWGFSAKVPFQQAASFPRILRLQDISLPPSLVLQTDRETYIASLQFQISQARKWMALVLSLEDVDFRVCFLESIISKGMHQSLACKKWEVPPCKKRAMDEEKI